MNKLRQNLRGKDVTRLRNATGKFEMIVALRDAQIVEPERRAWGTGRRAGKN